MKPILFLLSSLLIIQGVAAQTQDNQDTSETQAMIKKPNVSGLAPQKPISALDYFNHGLAMTRKGNLQKALTNYTKAKSMAPNWALPYLEIAVVHMMTDNDINVIGPMLEKAVEFGANLPRAHYLYGMYLKENNLNKEAAQSFTKTLQLRPSFTDARFQLAMILTQDGRQSEGIHHLHLILDEHPNHLGSRRTLAMLFEQSGMQEEAEEHLKHIVKFHPNNAYHITELAKFYQRCGKQKLAENAFKQALRLRDQSHKRKLRPLLKSRR